MRRRDLTSLESKPYDIAVVGGGIYGLACAYEGASRGLRIALVEAGDFAGGASFNHQKTAHGGLRALQTLSLGRAREAVRERRTLARIAPLLLRPLPFVVGTYRSLTRSRVALRTAFALDGWIARDRNAGLEPELHLPRARLLSRTAARKLFPGIREHGLTGGAQWYDYQMVENDRLTMAFAAAADGAGADLANYAEVRSVSRNDGMFELRVQDRITGAALSLRASALVNAAGSRAGEVMTMLGLHRPVPLLRAMNLVTTRPAADIALAAPDPTGRMLTLVPWRGRAIVGTWQSTAGGGGAIRAEEIDRFLAEANHAFPALHAGRADVALVHSASVPAAIHRNGTAQLVPRSAILDHRRDGVDGALTVLGAKFTTARSCAERVVDLLARKHAKPVARSRTAQRVLPGAGIADHEALALETARRLRLDVEPAVVAHLIRRYGERAADIIGVAAERPEWLRSIVSALPVSPAEIVHAIRHEQAIRLADIVLRRTTIGAAGHPGTEALAACAAVAGRELAWDEPRIRDEIADVESVYRVP